MRLQGKFVRVVSGPPFTRQGMSVDAEARVGSCHFANVAPRRAPSAHCPNEINTEGMKGGLIGEERGEEADGGTNPDASRR